MKTSVSLIFMLCLFTPGVVFSESARELVARGNKCYSAGDYDQALKAYGAAGETAPDRAEILFNEGNAHYQKQDFEKAAMAYEAAAIKAVDPAIGAKSLFNLGNVAACEAQRSEKSDPQKALAQYELSVRRYQEALRLNPQLKEAAVNIEAARLRMKDLLDRIENDQKARADKQQEQRDASTRNDDAKQNTPTPRPNPDEKQPMEMDADSPLKESAGEQSKTVPRPPESPVLTHSKYGEADREMREDTVENPEDILLEEKDNRLRRGQRFSSGYQDVEKDW